MLKRVLVVWALFCSALLLSAQTNGVYRELWSNLDPSVGNTLAALTNTASNPRWPDSPDPGFTKIFDTFETEVNSGMNVYGQRLRTYLAPPVSGNYTMWISSDDSSNLFLSTDEDPSHKNLIAWVAGWTSSRQWDVEANQKSAPISLVQGKRYYLEAIMQQGYGGDNLAVQWQLPDGTVEVPLPASRMQLASAPRIVAGPADTTVIEGRSASFTLGLANFVPPNFRWQLNGKDIIGGSNATLVIAPTPLSYSGAKISCIVSNGFGTDTSTTATLTVTRDTTLPTISSAYNFSLTSVLIAYSKPVDPDSATKLANYSIQPGVIIGKAVMQDAQTVALQVSPLTVGTHYTITVNGVQDLASVPNLIAANAQIGFQASDSVPAGIGSPPIPGSFSIVTNGIDMTGSGSDIGGNSDQFQFQYRTNTGNFDVQVRVSGLSPSDVFAKAALVARQDLTPNSPFAAAVTTPSIVNCFLESRQNPGDTAAKVGSFPVNYPNTWLRLQRIGSQCNGYASFDGSNWTLLGSSTLASTQVYLGFAVSSHNPNTPTTAQFRDYTTAKPGVGMPTSLPYEPLGPSSRKTSLVISEIMYKPTPRTDGVNLEYLEIFNTSPWAEDISKFRIGGSVQYSFPSNSIIPGGGYLVIAAVPGDMRFVYGITNVVGPYSGSLKKTGQIQVISELGAIMLDTTYDSLLPWPAGADGTGHSIALTRPSYGEADPRAWSTSQAPGGSPGGPESFRPSPLWNVTINEFLIRPTTAQSGFIELYNHSAAAVDISGCVLTTDSSTKDFIVPAATTIPAGGYYAVSDKQLGTKPNPAGGLLLLYSPDATMILDAVTYESQGLGISTGRWPNGAEEFYPLSAPTAAAANSDIRISDVVINEIMYAPISGNGDDQYVELYNRGTNAVDISGWQFVAGISHQFPTNTVLGPGGYLVVSRNPAYLIGNHPGLAPATVVGPFSGKLPHGGGRLALARPETYTSKNAQGTTVTNTLLTIEDEVTYQTGGRWGQWAHGGGSSLELRDPNSNHRLAYNWADSDETAKSAWTNLSVVARLDNGGSYTGAIDLVQVGLLDVGECLIDNIEFSAGTAGQNLVTNPGFESGWASWAAQGDHIRSSIEDGSGLGGYESSHSLHVRASDGIWTGFNSVQGTLARNTLGNGSTATMRITARWLRGASEVLLRCRGNWMELTGALPVPANLGTPGQPNSKAATSAGPAIFSVKHSPALPQDMQAVTVTARFHDVHSLKPYLAYRVDTAVNPAPTYLSLPMTDDGTRGDAIAGDGIYSATIPPQPAGTVIAFLVQATNSLKASTLFPADLHDNSGLPRECVICYGDPSPFGSFGHYHVWLTQNWIDRWNSLGGISNEAHDGTFVDGGGRIIYNWTGRYAGSPYHQYTGSPVYTTGGMHWNMPDDDVMLGATSFNKQHVPGNGPFDDSTLQREQASFWMARKIGMPWLYRRYYALFVNGNRHGPLMEDTQVPDGDYLKEYFPNDSGGWLYKNHSWFEFEQNLDPSGTMQFNNNSWCTLNRYSTVINGLGSQPKLAHYRWNYWIRQSPDSQNNFTNVYNLINAANASVTSPAYYSGMENLVDTEEYMRMSALEHATGDWDSVTTQNQWNMFSYKPVNGKWTLLKWDWNITLGNSGSWGPDGGNLFNVTGADGPMVNFQSYAPYRRAFLRAFLELASGPMNTTNISPTLDAKYSAFAASGLNTGFGVAEPGNAGLKNWIGTMHNSLLAAITNQGMANIPFVINGSTNIVTGATVFSITGSAPLQVKTILANGLQYPITWPTVKGWSLKITLPTVTNRLVLSGIDVYGNQVPGAIGSLTIIDTNGVPSERGLVQVNEWMASNKKTIVDPGTGQAEDWFELYNPNAFGVDLSGYYLTHDLSIPGLWQIPSGTLIGAKSFLLVWADNAATSVHDGTSHYLHANFHLSKSGTAIGLFDTATNLVDAITFGPQVQDVSEGRFPDGSTTIYRLVQATPGAANQFTNSPPVISAFPLITTNSGATVIYQFTATDPDVPPQVLTYSLDSSAPQNASIDPETGTFTWPIPASTVTTTNVVAVTVTDDGLPPLSSSTSLTIIAERIQSLPNLVSTELIGQQLILHWNAANGATYRVQSSPSLTHSSWTDLPGDFHGNGAQLTTAITIGETEISLFYRVIQIP